MFCTCTFCSLVSAFCAAISTCGRKFLFQFTLHSKWNSRSCELKIVSTGSSNTSLATVLTCIACIGFSDRYMYSAKLTVYDIIFILHSIGTTIILNIFFPLSQPYENATRQTRRCIHLAIVSRSLYI